MACIQSDRSEITTSDDLRWEEEKKFRYNCGILTSLLRAQVPVLDFVKWKVSSVEQGHAITTLPLISPSTNQHCTHQAALLFLAADYTGGIALASLIPHWPVIGVHPVAPSENPMALWLVKGEIKYFRPSVGRLEIEAQVDSKRHKRVKKRYVDGKTVLETITVRFHNGSTEVAEAVMTYYARQSNKLRSDGIDPDKVNVLYRHKLISSAELIAGVRARESGGLFEDPYASKIAGEHGVALAARFCDKSPQLGGMVAARTRHLDLQIQEFVNSGGRDLVLLGAGYDMRPFRLALPAGMRVYELDFPSVLVDRQRRLDSLGIKDPTNLTRIQLPVDLRMTPLATALEGLVDSTSPLFIAWEGMSMYFEEEDVRGILAGITPLLKNQRSRLWLDLIDQRAVTQPNIFPEVKEFMDGMQLLGEPFVFGVKSVKEFMESNGFLCHQVSSSDVFFSEQTDPVYSIYNFCSASANAITEPEATTGEQPFRTLHPGHLTIPPAARPEQTSSNEPAQSKVEDS